MNGQLDPASPGDVVRALACLGARRNAASREEIFRALGWNSPPPVFPVYGDSDLPLDFIQPPADMTLVPLRRGLPSELIQLERSGSPAGAERPAEGPVPLPPVSDHRPLFTAPIEALFQPRLARSMLARLASLRVRRGEIDTAMLVARVAAGRPFAKVPQRPVSTPAAGLHLLLDMSAAMRPFRDDVIQLIRQLRATLGADRIWLLRFEGCPEFGAADLALHPRDPTPSRTGVPVLAVTDLGLAHGEGTDNAIHVAGWHSFARRLARRRTPLTILSPYPAKRLAPASLAHRLRFVLWDRSAGVRSIPYPTLIEEPDD